MSKNRLANKAVAQGYDLIGDVHGCAQALELLLKKMGYQYSQGSYRHATRKAIFIGDIVDRGPYIREALHIVKDMTDQKQAEIVLGNHEYNALCYCTKGREGSNKQYLREHSARHHRMIRDTLEQFSEYPQEWQDFLAWFRDIPLLIEKPFFRVVHACWDAEMISKFTKRCPSNRIDDDFLHESSDLSSFAGRVIDRLTRGTALDLPKGESILGQDGLARKMFRTKFWDENPSTYSDVVFQPDPLPVEMAQRELSAIEKQRLLNYSSAEKPVFVGHYWMSGNPEPIKPNVACLDYSAVNEGRLVAYRMDDETSLSRDKFVWVDLQSA